MYQRLRLGSMANLLIQAAISSADKLGFGFANIREEKLFWVLSRMTVEIFNPLQWYDTAFVETWPKDVNKFLYIRDYIIWSQRNDIIAKATSGWLAIDIHSKRPKNIEGLDAEKFTRQKDQHALNYLPEKLDPVSEGTNSERKAGYFDIDLNGHVTATRYIDWMMDSFPIEFHQNNYPIKLSINYLRESMPGDSINIKKKQCSKNTFHFEGVNTNRKTAAFRGLIKF